MSIHEILMAMQKADNTTKSRYKLEMYSDGKGLLWNINDKNAPFIKFDNPHQIGHLLGNHIKNNYTQMKLSELESAIDSVGGAIDAESLGNMKLKDVLEHIYPNGLGLEVKKF